LISAESCSRVAERPWEWPWYRMTREDAVILPWIALIHVTAVVGLVLFPLPGWPVLLGAIALAFIGGLGTTVCYHRAIAHRALTLKPWALTILKKIKMQYN